MNIVAIAIGGALGAVLRYLLMSAAGRVLGVGFPWGTLVVNIVGCVAMGVAIGVLARLSDADALWRSFVCIGLLGGFTTFSAFSLDAVVMVERGELMPAALYIIGSVVLSIVGLSAGLLLTRMVTGAV